MTLFAKSVIFALLTLLSIKMVYLLNPGGRNVCSKVYSYTSYIYQQRTRTAQQRYYTSCGFWGWGRCAKTRFYTAYYNQKVSVTRYKRHYQCCSGWSSTGSDCGQAICSPTCQYGVCYAPNRCNCHTGWQGSYCNDDINECATNPCSQICTNLRGSYGCSCKIGFIRPVADAKHRECQDVDECRKRPCSCAPGSASCLANCTNTFGSFRCRCNAGHQLVNGKICTDIDECKVSGKNDCKHKCHNSLGSYFCSCNKGYRLGSDKRSCDDIDECATLNGGCSQKCTNLLGSYKCSCKTGLILAFDSKSCLDIDECAVRSPCDRINGFCRNSRGTYTCGCQEGYKLAPDKHTCMDIDECRSPSTNKCDQNCHNTIGSYFCSCRIGYLREGNTTCRDIDECKQRFHGCHHHCYNTAGSFYCGCRKGYKELPDGKNCQALPCQSLSHPQDGIVECTGQVTDQYCLFACKRGFQLLGSSNRTCTPSSIWTGEKTLCRRKICASPLPPKYGGITVPCHHDYDSVCSLKCAKDYYLVGQGAIKCDVNRTGVPFWNGNATCKAVELCNPNPCQHGGRCSIVNRNEFRCLCEKTGYTGVRCEQGYLEIPAFSRLTVSQLSEEFQYQARPENYLKVTITAKDNKATVQPSSLHFSKSVTTMSVHILALTAGKIELSYKFFGEGALYFIQPKNTVLYAQRSSVLNAPMALIPKSLTSLCYLHTLSKCKNGDAIQLASSCPWNDTVGYQFISVNSKQRRFPVSIVGVDISSFVTTMYLSPEEMVKIYLIDQKVPSCVTSTNCNNVSADQAVSFAQSNSLFIHSYQDMFSQITPNWLSLELADGDKSSNDFRPNDIFSRIGVASDFPVVFQDEIARNVSSQLYSVFRSSKKSFLRILSTKKSIGGSANYHLASSLCDSSILLKLDAGSEVNVTEELLSVGFVGLKEFLIHQLGFGDYERMCVSALDRVSVKKICQLPGMMSNVSVLVQFGQNNQLELDGRYMLSSKASTNLLFSGVMESLESIFYGRHVSNFTINLKGGTINIVTIENEAEGYIHFGGAVNNTSVFQEHGMSLRIKTSSLKFTYSSPQIVFKPQSFYAHTKYFYEAHGGNVISVNERRKLTLSLRSIKAAVDPRFMNVARILGSQFAADYDLLRKRAQVVMNEVSKLLSILTDEKPFEQAYTENRVLKSKYLEFDSAVRSLRKRLEGNPLLKSFDQTTRLHLLYLRKIRTLEVVSLRAAVTSSFKGFHLHYDGGICIYKLCFRDMVINMISKRPRKDCLHCSTISESNQFDSVTLKGKIIKETQLNSKIKFKVGDKLVLDQKAGSSTFSGNFTVTVHLFEKDYKVLFRIVDDKLMFTIPKVFIHGLLRFNIKGEYMLSDITWNTILQNIYGQSLSEDRDLLLERIENEMQSYFFRTGNYTGVRLEHSNTIVNESYLSVKTLEKKSLMLSDSLSNSSERLRISRLLYNRQLTLFNRYQTVLSSYQKDLTVFIEKSLDNLCQLKRCNGTCVGMPLKKICQDPLFSTVTLKKCDEVIKKVPTQVVEQFKKLCPVRIRQFQLVYTGSCAENPRKRAERQQLKRESLTSAGTGIGSLAGFLIGGPAGAAIGGIIGGIIEFGLSLFGGCDETYEEYESSYIEQQECTKLKEGVQLKEFRYSECYSVEKTVSSGYSQPRVCGVTNHSCIAIVNDPVCVRHNLMCQKHHNDFLRRNHSIPKSYVETFDSLKKAQSDLLLASSDVRKLEREDEIIKTEYSEIVILLKRERKRYELAVKGHKAMLQDLTLDICLHRFYLSSPFIKKHLTIKMFVINTTLPLIDNVLVEAHFDTKHEKKIRQTSFLVQFQDEQSYLTVASKRLIYEGLCSPKRRRRTTARTMAETLPFTSWYKEVIQSTSKELLACLTFKSAHGYLSRIAKDLLDSAKSWDMLSKELVRAQSETLQYKTLASDNEFISKQLQEVSLIEGYLNTTQLDSNVTQLLNEWKKNGEIYTGLSNNSACFNHEDCIIVAIDSLKNLPPMLSINLMDYKNTLATIQGILVDRLPVTKTIGELEQIATSLQIKLEYIKKVNLVCSKRPEVSIDLSESVKVTVNSTISLNCYVQSSLPVILFWLKDDIAIEGEHKKSLKINTQRSSKGFYKCMAISLAGNGTSNGTLLIIEYAPQFLEQPKHATHWLPSLSSVKPFFICNGTGNPEPDIRWYYHAYNESNPVILSANQSIYLPTLHRNASGYIYCELRNSVGKTKSRSVRLNIASHYIADQELHFSFKFTVIRGINGTGIDKNQSSSFGVNTPINNQTNINSTMTNDTKSNFNHVEISFDDAKQRMASNKFTNVTYILFGDGLMQSVKFVLSSKPSTWENGTNLENYFKYASKSRQNLANSFSYLLNDIIRNNSKIKADRNKLILVDNETLDLKYHQTCGRGYAVKTNGFVCGQCLPGWNEQNNKCVPCPIGTYQPFVGQTYCHMCPNSKTTELVGSTELSSCIYPNLCTTGKHNCHPKARCTMSGSTFTCKCTAGFTGNGVACSYIDLCLTKKNMCHQDAVCIPNGPTYTCQCRQGLTGNGFDCSPIDLCAMGLHNCHENAECFTESNGYECRCRSGYTGNGTTCLSLTEKGKRQASEPISRALIYGPTAGGVVFLMIIIVIIVIVLRKNRKVKASEKNTNKPVLSFTNEVYEHGELFATSIGASSQEDIHYARVVRRIATQESCATFQESSA